jgi:cob(I)alamin adenosyltransferase
MELESPPVDHRSRKATGARRGLLMIHTGDGKGKTTAAFGLAIRAHGRGKSVRFFQFMKVPPARFGEHRAFNALGLKVEGLGDGFSWKSRDLEHSAQLAREGWDRAATAIRSGEHFLVVLDEITYPLLYGWLPLEPVIECLRERPTGTTVLLTGRRAPDELIDIADTVTEMRKVKHHYDAGIPAQRGIED